MGHANSLPPGPRKLITTIGSKWRDVDGGSSRPQSRTKFTTEPFQDQVSRSRRKLLRKNSCLGSRGVSRKRGIWHLFRIPKGLNERQQGLLNLKATTTDCAHGPIPLSLKAAFGNWEGFKRHCDLMKAHALKKPFCDYSRDFFASAAPQESTTGVPRRRAGQG